MKKFVAWGMVVSTLMFLVFVCGYQYGLRRDNPVLAVPEHFIEPVQSETTDDDGTQSTDPQIRKLNLNTATAEELQTVPGIGPTIAGRILEYRKENGKFRVVSELIGIHGIGDKTFEKIEPYFTVS